MAPESWSCHSELLTHFLPFSTFCQKQSKQISTELLKKRGSPFLVTGNFDKQSGEFPRLICWIWFWYANIFCRKTECTWHSCHRQGVCSRSLKYSYTKRGKASAGLPEIPVLALYIHMYQTKDCIKLNANSF